MECLEQMTHGTSVALVPGRSRHMNRWLAPRRPRRERHQPVTHREDRAGDPPAPVPGTEYGFAEGMLHKVMLGLNDVGMWVGSEPFVASRSAA